MFAAVVYGLMDAVNPCLLFTLFYFIFMVFEYGRRRVNVFKYAAFFIATFYVSSLFFNMGLGMPILYSKPFFAAGHIFYVVAGTLLIIGGAVHLWDWWCLTRRGKQHVAVIPFGAGPYEEGIFDGKILILTIITAIILAAFSTIWPMNQYILLFSSYLFVPGKVLETFFILMIYNFMLVVPLLTVFVLIALDDSMRRISQSPSMAKVVLSALFIALGNGLIYIFL